MRTTDYHTTTPRFPNGPDCGHFPKVRAWNHFFLTNDKRPTPRLRFVIPLIFPPDDAFEFDAFCFGSVVAGRQLVQLGSSDFGLLIGQPRQLSAHEFFDGEGGFFDDFRVAFRVRLDLSAGFLGWGFFKNFSTSSTNSIIHCSSPRPSSSPSKNSSEQDSSSSPREPPYSPLPCSPP